MLFRSCASLLNQPKTVQFVLESLDARPAGIGSSLPTDECYGSEMATILPELPSPQTSQLTIKWIKQVLSDPLYEEVDMDDIMRVVTEKEWLSEAELIDFFKVISIELAQTATKSSGSESASIFERSIFYGLSIYSPYYTLWEKCFLTRSERLRESVSIREWDTEVDGGIEELSLITLIPLATAYELPLFEALRNNVLDSLTEPQEEFLGYVAAMLGPGYYDGEVPPEILNIPSSKILSEILEDWTQYRDLWTSECLTRLLESPYADQEVRRLIAKVLQGDDENDPDGWNEHVEYYWADGEIAEVLSLCTGACET